MSKTYITWDFEKDCRRPGWRADDWKAMRSREVPWKQAYHAYLNTCTWLRRRLKRLRRDDFTCQSCGFEGDEHSLHVHHLTYKRITRERQTDLTSLCPDCHRGEHGIS